MEESNPLGSRRRDNVDGQRRRLVPDARFAGRSQHEKLSAAHFAGNLGDGESCSVVAPTWHCADNLVGTPQEWTAQIAVAQENDRDVADVE